MLRVHKRKLKGIYLCGSLFVSKVNKGKLIKTMRYEIERADCTVTVLIFLFYGSWTHPSHVLTLVFCPNSVGETHACCLPNMTEMRDVNQHAIGFFLLLIPGYRGKLIACDVLRPAAGASSTLPVGSQRTYVHSARLHPQQGVLISFSIIPRRQLGTPPY